MAVGVEKRLEEDRKEVAEEVGDLRDGGKHALVDGEHEVGYPGTSHTRLREDISEADVLEITDIFASGMRKGEGVAPEEPLKRCHARRHHAEPNQRQGRFPPSQARVEKAVLNVSRLSSAVLVSRDRVRWITYPTPGIMSRTRAVAASIHAISPD